MNINIQFEDKSPDFRGFAPVAGTYGLEDSGADKRQVEQAISWHIKDDFGYAVRVEIYKTDGRDVVEEAPISGTFLAVRNDYAQEPPIY